MIDGQGLSQLILVESRSTKRANADHADFVGAPIPPTFVTPQHLQKTINQAQSASNGRLRSNMSQLLACAEGAFDFSPTDINLPATVLAIARTEEPAEHFEEWLGSVWTSPPSADTSATASASLGVPSHETSRSSSAKSGTKSR